MKKINLAVIFGGQSSEHEVSLSSARGVIEALDQEKYNLIPMAITKSGSWLIGKKGDDYLEKFQDRAGIENGISLEDSEILVSENDENLFDYVKKNKLDLVLPILHGPFGEDGRIQGLLDMFEIPYVFSGVLAHALAMNKYKAKIIAKNNGVLVARDMLIDEKYDLESILQEFDLPLIVKPVESGSSVGVSLVRKKEELGVAVEKALAKSDQAIIEEYIRGREFTATLIGDRDPEMLAITEIIPKISDFYDYKAKYEQGGSEHVCPAKIPENIAKEIEDQATNVYRAIGCRDLSRADFIWNEEKGVYFIEINTIPGMTPTSLAPEAAKNYGLNFTQFLDKIINLALERKKYERK